MKKSALRNIVCATISGVLTSSLIFSLSSPALAKKSTTDENKNGRAGMWRSNTQGAPSIEACRKVVAEKPNDAIAHNDLGWALRQNKDPQGAEAELREAIKLDDKLASAHSNLSVCLSDQSKFQPALDEARKAVAIDQSQPIFHVVLGNALSATGDNAAAVEEYKIAISQRDDYENAYYNLGRVLDAMGEKTEAGKVLANALKLDPNDERVLKILDKIVK
ncbi:MAG: tetratricopeptide repeat protein [Cyanobacteria bacterium SZAS LIN-2]|nr:tetratricopeptide repeat protein [Cyanobacteria bacterium SZAS LIN-3]MBS1996652.1 tetratricopeptide repeat protein [Cyanobacteria bacterium SZAS LIN-2]